MDRTSGHKIQRTALISRPKTPIIGRALRASRGRYFTADIDAQGGVQVMKTNRSVLPGLLTAVFLMAAIGPAAYGQLSERAEFLNAVEDGAHRKVKLMALGTMNIDARNENGTPALVMAVRNGDDVMVNMLVEAGADPDIVDRASGETPLTLAASRNNLDMVERLLKAGADPNVENQKYETPLIKAIQNNGNRDVISALLEAGADPTWQDFTGHSALWYAKKNRRPNITRMLKQARGSD